MRLPWMKRGAGYCSCGSVLDRRWHGFIGHTPDGKRSHREREAEWRAQQREVLNRLRYTRRVPYEADPELTIDRLVIKLRPWYLPEWWWSRIWMFKRDTFGKYPIVYTVRRRLGVW